ncbi:MAG: hypothetical protein ABH863_03450 [Candidatus Micrarchaeota archaeon]
MGQVKELLRAYKFAHKYREEWYNIKWRMLVILASVSFIIFVNQYLYGKYDWFVEEFNFFLAERLFYWFMIGALFGIIAVGMIFEGEFLIGLRNIANELSLTEKGMERKEKPKAAKRRR